MKVLNKLTMSLMVSVALTGTALADGFYSISNKADGNTVFAYKKDDAGKYQMLGEYKTGGTGTGDLEIPALKKDSTHPLANGDDPLISAHAVMITDDGKHVLAVNPGDGTVSLMKVGEDDSLESVSTAPASDKFPISIAESNGMVAVAAVGDNNGAGSVSAFKIEGDKLVPVEGSRRDLKARPSTIEFSSDGKFVVVNELVTGKIHSFAAEGGTLSKAPVSTVDSPRAAEDRFQAIPVGFTIHGDLVLMSEARFLTPDFKLREEKDVVVQSPLYSWQTGSVSTYKLSADGKLTLVSADVLTGDKVEGGEIANCWVAISADGKTLWAANALSSSISSFKVKDDGSIELMNATAYKDDSEKLFFGDIAVSKDGKEVYQHIGNQGQVMILDIQDNGDLVKKQVVDGMPKLGAYGVASY